MFEQSVIAAAQAHAVAEYPRESCGLVVDGKYTPYKNIHPKPEQAFKMATNAWLSAHKRGEIQAVIHSHPDGPDCPSADDMQGQVDTAIPWGIICTDGKDCLPTTWFGDAVPTPTLTGRGFRHGVTDCYSLIRDYYKTQRGILLPEFPRNWEWWTEDDGDLYGQGFKQAGFVKITPEEVRPGDVFLAQIMSKVPNHGGVLLEGGLALHHLSAKLPVDMARLSRREPLNRWRNHVTHWLRYEG